MLHVNRLGRRAPGRAILPALVAVGTAGLLPGRSPAVPPPVHHCMSVEATGGPDNWTLSCTGSCGEGECEERSVTIGGRNIRACACTLSNLETACCQVVLDSDGNPAKIGNCPACPASGQCTLDPPGDPQTVSCDR